MKLIPAKQAQALREEAIAKPNRTDVLEDLLAKYIFDAAEKGWGVVRVSKGRFKRFVPKLIELGYTVSMMDIDVSITISWPKEEI